MEATIYFISATFAGYIVGRISHLIAHDKHIQAIHHWVWGVLIVAIGLVFFGHELKILVIGFGLGLAISDLNDMLKLRFYGVDKFEKQKFWGIK